MVTKMREVKHIVFADPIQPIRRAIVTELIVNSVNTWEGEASTLRDLFREMLSNVTGVEERYIEILDVDFEPAGSDMMNNNEKTKFVQDDIHIDPKLLLTIPQLKKAKTKDWYKKPKLFATKLGDTPLAKDLKMTFNIKTPLVVEHHSGMIIDTQLKGNSHFMDL